MSEAVRRWAPSVHLEAAGFATEPVLLAKSVQPDATAIVVLSLADDGAWPMRSGLRDEGKLVNLWRDQFDDENEQLLSDLLSWPGDYS